jgi:FkbM family methyltransferase
MVRQVVRSVKRITHWAHEVVCYAVETRSVYSLGRLMRIRLALSRVGPWACPQPCIRDVTLRSLGGPVRLRSHTTDISVLNELIVSNGYVAAAELIPSPATILDLGANTGLAARWFLNRWPHAQIVAVEPEPGNVEMLRANLASTSAQVLPVAVGGWAREALLSTTHGEFSYTIVGASNETAIKVPVETMATILKKTGVSEIGLLKADIEGAEDELFADCSDWIHRVRALVVECHNGYTAQDLLSACKRGGAEFRLLDLDDKPEWGFQVVTGVRVTQ